MMWLLLLLSVHAADPDWVEVLKPQLSSDQLERVRAIASGSDLMGTGVAGPTRHAMTPEACVRRREEAGVQLSTACGFPHMVGLPDGHGCIDQFEFPNVPCTYPVVWVRASEAAALCESVGKRLCDASEWEDGCAGTVGPEEDLSRVRHLSGGDAQRALRGPRNAAVETSWAYGSEPRAGVCAMASFKNETCDGGSPKRCGSNTYPTGAFPACVSSIGVYDQHGNAAEHMSLPVREEQRRQANGVTEMKGSWFIFDSYRAHPDHCRWRAPFWHGTSVRDPDSHRNYHLGFRCCADAPSDASSSVGPR